MATEDSQLTEKERLAREKELARLAKAARVAHEKRLEKYLDGLGLNIVRFYIRGEYPGKTITSSDGTTRDIEYVKDKITGIVLAPLPQAGLVFEGKPLVHWRLHFCTSEAVEYGPSMAIDVVKPSATDKRYKFLWVCIQSKDYSQSNSVEEDDHLVININRGAGLTTLDLLLWIQEEAYHVYKMDEARSGCLARCCTILKAMQAQRWINHGADELKQAVIGTIENMRNRKIEGSDEPAYSVPKDGGIFKDRDGEVAEQYSNE
ncbi:hypothetical protein BD410DRAFT_844064 [Rickenella mellea]|uniref:DUF7770 domain-containing protein n=1 Tax=Rickenella mellea TaxID=50990 RepID=A0A4Y7PP41_9AGAM|nr:hypothetical protein BD410DRAFT_844064 [Rickenella mellea]